MPFTGFRNGSSLEYWSCRYFEAVTVNELPKCLAMDAPTSDFPVPVGAHQDYLAVSGLYRRLDILQDLFLNVPWNKPLWEFS